MLSTSVKKNRFRFAPAAAAANEIDRRKEPVNLTLVAKYVKYYFSATFCGRGR